MVYSTFGSVQTAPLRRFPRPDAGGYGFDGLVINDPYRVSYNGLIVRDNHVDPRIVFGAAEEKWYSGWVIPTAVAGVGLTVAGLYFLLR